MRSALSARLTGLPENYAADTSANERKLMLIQGVQFLRQHICDFGHLILSFCRSFHCYSPLR